MTGPIQERADDLADRTAVLSDDTESAVTGALQLELDRTQRALIARWVRDFGSTEDGPQDRDDAARFAKAARSRLLAAMDPELLNRDALSAAQSLAYDMGALGAAETSPFPLRRRPVPAEQSTPDLGTAVDEALSQAILGLSEDAVEDQQFEAVAVAMRRAGTSVSRVRATVAYEITSAVSAGVRAVAEASGAGLVWVAERDACLVCLAYAGATVTGDDLFPDDLTFETTPMSAPPGPLLGPPRHPHCRCVLQLWHPDDVGISEGLKREAKRSVLRGWSESDSDPARVRAAARLLAVGSGLPKSVEQVARRAVKAGRFNTRNEGSGS